MTVIRNTRPPGSAWIGGGVGDELEAAPVVTASGLPEQEPSKRRKQSEDCSDHPVPHLGTVAPMIVRVENNNEALRVQARGPTPFHAGRRARITPM